MIQLSDKHQAIVEEVLRAHLGKSHRVFVFGSRAKGSAQPFSDLDLCIEGEPLSFEALFRLKDAFSNSDLPYMVDIVEKSSMSHTFYDTVEADFCAFPMD